MGRLAIKLIKYRTGEGTNYAQIDGDCTYFFSIYRMRISEEKIITVRR